MQNSKWASNPTKTSISTSSSSYEDQFAQTRQPDDLFDDDFTPISTPISQPVPPEAPRSTHPQFRPRGDRPPRSRGRGHAQLRNHHQNGAAPSTPIHSTPSPPKTTSTSVEATTSTEPPPSTPTDAVPPKPTTTASVRGSRLNTGGIQKPKLTEDELSARLEAARLNNAKREEAHRLAEADEASFQQREELAREKRREEGLARRVMEGEREKNRLRKLKGGREWDEGKEEQVVERGGGRGFRRGMYGAVERKGVQGSDTGVKEESEEAYSRSGRGGYEGRRGRGRGRGGRGRGRGESGGRGGHDGRGGGAPAPASFVDTDFPALGNAGKKEAQKSKIVTLETADIIKAPDGGKGTWADQVETNIGETAA